MRKNKWQKNKDRKNK